MKVQKYEIARVIDKLKSIVQKNDQFPALGGILVKDGYLIASNSEITMKVKLEASEGSCFIIPMKAFDLIKNLPDGEIFEQMIVAASRFYEEKGIAAVDKTPEAFKVLKPLDRNRGQFICCFTKQAQPDFKGALMDSTMILFDAKHTDKDRIGRDVVTAEQEACFERYMQMDAMCFLVVSLGFEEFYRVPWVVFRDMKKIYGHKYMNREELEPYRIKYMNGVVKYLDGIALRERNENESTEV